MELTELQQMQRRVKSQRAKINVLKSHIQKLKEELFSYYELPVSKAVKEGLIDHMEHKVINYNSLDLFLWS